MRVAREHCNLSRVPFLLGKNLTLVRPTDLLYNATIPILFTPPVAALRQRCREHWNGEDEVSLGGWSCNTLR